MGHRVTTLNVNAIEPAGSTLTLGASGDTIVATDSVNVNTVKDAGGGATTNVVAAFTSTGASTWTCPTGVTSAEILIVGGGGGSGRNQGGGGGAGGVVHHATYTVVPAVVYDITVGTGGPACTGYSSLPTSANDGNDSVFNVNSEGSGSPMTAVGGGAGGADLDPRTGGSGGGGNGNAGSRQTGATGSQGDSGGGTGYGNDGGDGVASPSRGGGGGGADEEGNIDGQGFGGDGKLFSSFTAYGTDSSNVASTGSNGGYFGGGGAGGNLTASPGIGGGGTNEGDTSKMDGLANTGGGGGANNGDDLGGDGGTGVVLISYNTGAADPTTLWVSDGSGNLSSVDSAFGDDLKLLSTQTASGSASLSFTSGLDSTYKEYIFRFYLINPATDSVKLQFQMSSDGGSNYNITTTSTYWSMYNDEADTVSGYAYDADNDQAQGTAYQPVAISIGYDADQCAVGELHLFNPSSATYVKNYYSRTQTYQKDNFSVDAYTGGYFNTTTALNAISFSMSSGNFDGTIMMYGVA